VGDRDYFQDIYLLSSRDEGKGMKYRSEDRKGAIG